MVPGVHDICLLPPRHRPHDRLSPGTVHALSHVRADGCSPNVAAVPTPDSFDSFDSCPSQFVPLQSSIFKLTSFTIYTVSSDRETAILRSSSVSTHHWRRQAQESSDCMVQKVHFVTTIGWRGLERPWTTCHKRAKGGGNMRQRQMPG